MRSSILNLSFALSLVFALSPTAHAEVMPRQANLAEDYKILLWKQIYTKVIQDAGMVRFPGRVVLRVTIDRNGSVVKSEIVERSDSLSLDSIVLHAVPVGARLTPFPSTVKANFLNLTVPVNFRRF